MSRKVPTLSLKKYTSGSLEERAIFSKELIEGLKEFGFFILKDHNLKPHLLRHAYQLSKDFFTLPLSEKQKYIVPGDNGQTGYTAFGVEHAKDSNVADLKEFWHVGRTLDSKHPYYSQFSQNIWPKIDNFKEVFLEVYKELDFCGDIILEALCLSLDLEANYFKKLTNDGNSILRLLHYPPVPKDCDPKAIRAAAHEDINLITLLVSASASGLQLKDRDGTWLDVNAEENQIIVDSGDMLARITNDILPSTTHRVINPTNNNLSRYSMPFFLQPNPDAVLSCIPSCKKDQIKYPDVKAQDFLNQRLKEIGLKK